MNYHSHLGVYGCVLDASAQALLVIKKARGPYTGLYDLPGGSMEENELLEETLLREIKEETSCEVQHFSQLSAETVRFEYQQEGELYTLRHIGILYAVDITGTPREEGDGEDSNGCMWLPLTEISEQTCTPLVVKSLDFLT